MTGGAIARPMNVKLNALSFVLRNPFIDGVLIGVDNISQLQNNINVAICTKEVEELAKQITVKETYLLNPSNWL